MKFLSTISVSDYISPLDWLTLAISLVLTIAAVLYGHRKKHLLNYSNKNKERLEYLVMGRQLTLPLFIATLCSTWYGGIFGVTQNAFNHGIYNFITQGVFWYISYIIFALCFVKKIRQYHVSSLPELIKKLYGDRSATFSAILIFFKTVPITSSISIGIFLKFFLPISLEMGIAIGVVFVMLYSLWGGFRAVVYSDFAQFLLMCFGVASVVWFSYFNLGGFTFLQLNLPESYFKPCGTFSFSNTLVWLLIAFSATFINPAFYQRCFAAQNTTVAIKGILYATLIWLLFDCCTTLGGMYAKAAIPEADSLNAYLIYSLQLLPPGYRGLLLASIIATILSTLDSFLIIASGIIAYDLNWFKFKSTKLKQAMALSLTSLFSIGLSHCFDGNIENIWRLSKSYFSVCLLIPLAWGYLFPKTINDRQLITTCIGVCCIMTLWKLLGYDAQYDLDNFYLGSIIIISLFSILSFIKLYQSTQHS